MLAFVSTFLYKSIWRIRHTEETRSVFEVDSEQLQIMYKYYRKKAQKHKFLGFSLKAPTRFELVIEVLQTFALPLGYGAIFN